jgi:hypothetical protein
MEVHRFREASVSLRLEVEMYAALGRDEVLKAWELFQGIEAGMDANTPNGSGVVAGKRIGRAGMEVLVDHGARVSGVPIVVTYPIQVVQIWRKKDELRRV